MLQLVLVFAGVGASRHVAAFPERSACTPRRIRSMQRYNINRQLTALLQRYNINRQLTALLQRYNIHRQRTALLAQCFADPSAPPRYCRRYWPVLAGTGRRHQPGGTSRRHWAVLGGTGRYWAALGGTGRHWAVLGGTGRYWVVLAGTGRYWPAVLAGTSRHCWRHCRRHWPVLGGTVLGHCGLSRAVRCTTLRSV